MFSPDQEDHIDELNIVDMLDNHLDNASSKDIINIEKMTKFAFSH